MEINLSENIKNILIGFILLILPLLVLVLGLIINLLNAWFYVGVITWFTLGVIYFNAIE